MGGPPRTSPRHASVLGPVSNGERDPATSTIETMDRSIRLNPERLAAAKTAYTTRRVRHGALQTLITTGPAPRPGDLVLARVTEIGHHERIERPDGRRARLFPGDEVLLAYGHRYAPDQFEAEVPEDLRPCHLAAAGGVASIVLSAHDRMDEPTSLEPIGLVGDADGTVVNLDRFALAPVSTPVGRRPPVIAVAGTSMNSGKTTTVAHIVRGLAQAGLAVGATKVTGTGAGGDPWLFTDAGAARVLDFVDAGHATTYRLSTRAVENVFSTLVGHLASLDAIVIEVADGLFQEETDALLSSEVFARTVDRIVFAAGDALGATVGVRMLRQRGLPVVAVSGLLTASPLARREARAVHLPVLGLEDLAGQAVTEQLLSDAALPRSA